MSGVLLQAKRVRPGDVLTDSRFAAMFENRDFEVDLDADEYKQLHPNAGEPSNTHKLNQMHASNAAQQQAAPCMLPLEQACRLFGSRAQRSARKRSELLG